MMIAERFNYQIESRALMAGEEASEGEEANRGVIFPAVLELDKDHKNWRNAGASDLGDANPLLGRWSIKSRTDSSERRRLFDEIDQYAQLGLWYRLATIYEPPAPSDSERTGEKPRPRLMNITVTLEAPEKLGEAAIADAVRIRRRDGRSAR
jgi:hypothetical protein